MKKLLIILSIIVLTTSCTSFGFQSPRYEVVANTNGEVGTLEGTSTSHFLFGGLISWGDSSVVTAAKDSGGRYIRTVDQHISSFLGIYCKYTTVVTTENTPPDSSGLE